MESKMSKTTETTESKDDKKPLGHHQPAISIEEQIEERKQDID